MTINRKVWENELVNILWAFRHDPIGFLKFKLRDRDEYDLLQRCSGCTQLYKTWYGYRCGYRLNFFYPLICPFKSYHLLGEKRQ